MPQNVSALLRRFIYNTFIITGLYEIINNIEYRSTMSFAPAMLYNKHMTETDVQKVLFKRLVDSRKGRGLFRFAVPNVYFYGWESDFLGYTKAGYLHEFEIKTSINDFRADAGKKKKHQLMGMFHKSPSPTNMIPKRFYYVINGFWLNQSDVPQYAGLLICTHGGQIKTIKRAPDLPAVSIVNNDLIKLSTSLSYRYFEKL